ncbi:hypothetical protein B0H13DRAFT_2322702 [Mycena leptocephala]|nr:hypothetical protein B0H13DRAFT_2322702 [Mycena leptocephala]
MFFSASIAFTFFISLSGIAHGAPVTLRAATVDLQVCDGTNGSGTCTPLNFVLGNSEGVSNDAASCTNVSNAKSLIMDLEDDCTLFEFDDCNVGSSFAREIFQSDDVTNNLPPTVKSISCQRVDGLVNGLFPDRLGDIVFD